MSTDFIVLKSISYNSVFLKNAMKYWCYVPYDRQLSTYHIAGEGRRTAFNGNQTKGRQAGHFEYSFHIYGVPEIIVKLKPGDTTIGLVLRIVRKLKKNLTPPWHPIYLRHWIIVTAMFKIHRFCNFFHRIFHGVPSIFITFSARQLLTHLSLNYSVIFLT